MINQELSRLIQFGLNHGLLQAEDVDYAGNRLIEILKLPEFFFEPNLEVPDSAAPILDLILNDALERGVLESNSIDFRDLLDTELMDCLMPRPSEVIREFYRRYEEASHLATDYYYDLSKASNYIRTARVAKDKRWKVATKYGVLDMTINLSKPEKDPKLIALAKSLPSSNYPKCLLCKENVGFSGHLNHPARQNHRIIPLELVSEKWHLQYSPYVYYNEHCIILKDSHDPMVVSKLTFERLLGFVEKFKHYFVGSNADLPIVGGSILTHDHFQGGAYQFAMETAKPLKTYQLPGYSHIQVEFLNWPLSVLRLKAENPVHLSELGDRILAKWRGYSDEALGIHAFTGETPHNTITPIARFRDGLYELDLVLRNNRTSEAHPDGIYHPHAQYHHLKKENIGLIEVMGLAVLPGRLVTELEVIQEALEKNNGGLLETAGLQKHLPWFQDLQIKAAGLSREDIAQLIADSVGQKFAEILACCGVFKLDEAGLSGIDRFVEAL